MNEPRLPEHVNHQVLFAAALAALRNAVLLIAPGRKPAYANPAFLQLSGYDYDELMSLSRTSVISAPSDEHETTERLNQALQGKATSFRLRPVVQKDGQAIWTEAAITPITLQGDRYLLAEFRPTCEASPDGAPVWRPA